MNRTNRKLTDMDVNELRIIGRDLSIDIDYCAKMLEKNNKKEIKNLLKEKTKMRVEQLNALLKEWDFLPPDDQTRATIGSCNVLQRKINKCSYIDAVEASYRMALMLMNRAAIIAIKGEFLK